MATDIQIRDEAKASLLRLLQADTVGWSEGQHQQRLLSIKELESVIEKYEARTASSAGRRIHVPIQRVNF